jgi:hypothetical protein
MLLNTYLLNHHRLFNRYRSSSFGLNVQTKYTIIILISNIIFYIIITFHLNELHFKDAYYYNNNLKDVGL